MEHKIKAKISELIYQAATWEYSLIRELNDQKRIIGYVGTEKLLTIELKKYSRLSVPSSHYLMQLVSVFERLQKLGIPQEIYQKLPLSRWRDLLAITTQENAGELTQYIIEGGELNEIKTRYAKGYKLRYNLYSAEFEFITKDGENGDN